MKRQTFTSVWGAIENRAGSAANMRVRAELMVEIERYVRGKELSQSDAAKKLGVTQPRLNDLLRGKIDKFLDALMKYVRPHRQTSFSPCEQGGVTAFALHSIYAVPGNNKFSNKIIFYVGNKTPGLMLSFR